MNLYLRYFDDECVVTSVDDALNFISAIPDFNMTPQFEADFRQYAEGPLPYPKRYKVRSRVYFIVIKTTAATIEEFKAHGKADEGEMAVSEETTTPAQSTRRLKEQILSRLTDEKPGWYEGSIFFKRVVVVPETGKFDYKDTTFVARVKAHSPQDCYNRIIDHLRTRSDIDPRSQFPSVKGKNFKYTYLGMKAQ